jgi:nucleoid DNA-binding protein
MRNTDIAEQIARETGVSQGEAADQLDEVITSILKNLRNGQPADLPGLGRLRRDIKGGLQFLRSGQRSKNDSR